MSNEDLIDRGKITLAACLGIMLLLAVAGDLWWGTLFMPPVKVAFGYFLRLSLVVAIWKGATWAKNLLAFLLIAGAVLACFTLVRLGTFMPTLSLWTGFVALVYALIAAVLALSPSIDAYLSSRNELLLPD